MEDFRVLAKVGKATTSHIDWGNIYAEAFGVDCVRPDPTMACRECWMWEKKGDNSTVYLLLCNSESGPELLPHRR